jgi:hypothetical protein
MKYNGMKGGGLCPPVKVEGGFFLLGGQLYEVVHKVDE